MSWLSATIDRYAAVDFTCADFLFKKWHGAKVVVVGFDLAGMDGSKGTIGIDDLV
jgi:hypothetical protein